MYIPSVRTVVLTRFMNTYHNQILPPYQCCYDYLVPVHLFQNKTEALHKYNLIPCDRYTSVLRNGCALGNIDTISPSVYRTVDERRWLPIHDLLGQTTGYMDQCNKIFYPSRSCQRGLIARYLMEMLLVYPHLYRHLPEIVQDNSILSQWQDYPITMYEVYNQ